jgi:hypothetical protein
MEMRHWSRKQGAGSRWRQCRIGAAKWWAVAVLGVLLLPAPRSLLLAQSRLDRLKAEVAADVDRRAPLTRQMVDQVFSYGELGFQ